MNATTITPASAAIERGLAYVAETWSSATTQALDAGDTTMLHAFYLNEVARIASATAESALDGHASISANGAHATGLMQGYLIEIARLDEVVTPGVPTHVSHHYVRGGEAHFRIPVTVSVLGAFRSKGPAQRRLASYDDCITDEQVGQRVQQFDDINGGGTYWLALHEYNRPVRG